MRTPPTLGKAKTDPGKPWPFRVRGTRIMFAEPGAGGHRFLDERFTSAGIAKFFAARYNAAYVASLRDRVRFGDPGASVLLGELGRRGW